MGLFPQPQGCRLRGGVSCRNSRGHCCGWRTIINLRELAAWTRARGGNSPAPGVNTSIKEFPANPCLHGSIEESAEVQQRLLLRHPVCSEEGRKQESQSSDSMTELQQLIQNAIPCAREVLRDNYSNLLKVADYCESNYLQAEDKRKALEATMAFTAQSLASVAYQIRNLAGDILKTLDLQASEIRKVEASVCSIAQIVEMHKEKVSRREIGSLTICKTLPCYQKIIYPKDPEPLEPYYKKPLNFSSLDEIGHGIKDQSTQLARTGTLSRRSTKISTGQSSGSLGRSQPVQPPFIPDGKLFPASSLSSLSSATEEMENTSKSAPPEPPPPPPSVLSLLPLPPETDDFLPSPQSDTLPPPPVGLDDILAFSEPDLDFPASPPPPPPLDITHCEPFGPPLLPPPPPPEKLPWAPETYLEKVVTLYPYTQQKENELSFEEGAVIYVTRKYSDGWCEGVTSDAAGLFPANYVEPLH
ncbi:ABI gene family member 3 isoform X1 [Pogona vitticeps]